MSLPNELISSSLGGAADTGYQIQRSIRLNSADSAYLSRSPSSAGNRKTWTWSGWVKRGAINGVEQTLFSAGNATLNVDLIRFDSSNQLDVLSAVGGVSWRYTSSALYRDPGAWMHIQVAVDTTNSTAADRVKIYINGIRLTEFSSSSAPSSSYDNLVNSSIDHAIGYDDGNNSYHLNGYLADVHFIDAQALLPTDFGKFDDNNVWQPKAFSGTYGTNGFHLDFSDNSSNAALGTDSSGNSNTWTVNNLSAPPSNTGLYASNFVSSNGFNASYPALKAFDGSTSTYAQASTTGGTLTFTPSSGISYSSSIKIYMPSAGATASVNGGSSVSVANSSETTIATGSGTLTSLVLAASNLPGLAYIKIDDQILVNSGLDSGTDSLLDTPTNYGDDTGAGGEVGGNYATFNPLLNYISAAGALTNGNLTLEANSGGFINGKSSIPASVYNCYCEVNVTAGGGLRGIGVGDVDAQIATGAGSYVTYRENGAVVQYPGNTTLATIASYTTGDLLGMAINSTQILFYKNGTLVGTYSHSLTGTYYVIGMSYYVGAAAVLDYNFGQRPFAFAAPSGYKALCTTNLPEPTIADGSAYFGVKTWNGTGSSQAITGYGFSPDFAWIKARNNTASHALLDTVRGNSIVLKSEVTNAETTNTSVWTSFDSDGFTLGADTSAGWTNYNNWTYVGWAWDAGSSTVSNTDGSITSSVRANASAGFSIVTWTGTANATVGHGLNATPQLVITKSRNNSTAWRIWSAEFSDADSNYLGFDTNAVSTFGGAYWGSMTSTTIGLSAASYDNNYGEMLAYCFAPVEGYSAMGSYTGNGSADGPFVFTGFRTRFLLYRRTDVGSNWYIMDTERDPDNVTTQRLLAESSGAEYTYSSTDLLDVNANGFKVRSSNNAINANGGTYVYYAVAENPFKTARAR